MKRFALAVIVCSALVGFGSAKFARISIGPDNSFTVKEMNSVETDLFYTIEIAPRVAAQVASLLGAVVVDMNEVDRRIDESEQRMEARIALLPLGADPNFIKTAITASELRSWQVARDMCDAKIKEFETTRLTLVIADLGARLAAINP